MSGGTARLLPPVPLSLLSDSLRCLSMTVKVCLLLTMQAMPKHPLGPRPLPMFSRKIKVSMLWKFAVDFSVFFVGSLLGKGRFYARSKKHFLVRAKRCFLLQAPWAKKRFLVWGQGVF